MPAHFRCPYCGAETDVDDAYVGQTGPCFSCGKNVTVSAKTADSPAVLKAGKSGQSRVVVGVVMVFVVVGTLAALGILWLGFVVARPVINQYNVSSTQSNCRSNLSQIALAMQQYHDDFGCYPPAYVADGKGRPMHSWRVLLLPYLEEGDRYQQYDKNQPWDSQYNLAITARMPAVFACPADENAAASGETSYLVIVGDETMFPGIEPATKGDVSDGLANTIMVVEVAKTSVPWTKPADLDIRSLTFEINGRGAGEEISSMHPGGAVFATGDGSTYFLPDATPPSIVQALVTARGDELVDLKKLAEFGKK